MLNDAYREKDSYFTCIEKGSKLIFIMHDWDLDL